MKTEEPESKTSSGVRILASLMGLPWIEIVAEAWKLGRKILRGLADEGMYEVIEFETTLELLDHGGTKALVKKRKKIRYLQNGIIAYQDYGWADGEYFLDYQVSPGVAVDQYKVGHNKYVLISLRGIKNKGDIDEFHIEWKIKNGFLTPDGYWQSDVANRTEFLKVNIVFPPGRPPQRVRLEEHNIRRTSVFEAESLQRLPDRRWQTTWEISKPRLFEQYILRWEW